MGALEHLCLGGIAQAGRGAGTAGVQREPVGHFLKCLKRFVSALGEAFHARQGGQDCAILFARAGVCCGGVSGVGGGDRLGSDDVCNAKRFAYRLVNGLNVGRRGGGVF